AAVTTLSESDPDGAPTLAIHQLGVAGRGEFAAGGDVHFHVRGHTAIGPDLAHAGQPDLLAAAVGPEGVPIHQDPSPNLAGCGLDDLDIEAFARAVRAVVGPRNFAAAQAAHDLESADLVAGAREIGAFRIVVQCTARKEAGATQHSLGLAIW